MSEPEPTVDAEPGPPTPGEEGPTAGTTPLRPRRPAGVAGAAVGDLLVRLEAQIFRAQPTAQLQVTRTDEVTAQTSDGPVVVAFPEPLSGRDRDEPAGGA